MTVKGKIQSAFPYAQFYIREDGTPSICTHILGLLIACPKEYGCLNSCDGCWSMEWDEEQHLRNENIQLRSMAGKLWALCSENGVIYL